MVDVVVDTAEQLAEILKQLYISYGIFGIASILFIFGAIKKIAKFILVLLFIVAVASLVYGGYLSFWVMG